MGLNVQMGLNPLFDNSHFPDNSFAKTKDSMSVETSTSLPRRALLLGCLRPHVSFLHSKQLSSGFEEEFWSDSLILEEHNDGLFLEPPQNSRRTGSFSPVKFLIYTSTRRFSKRKSSPKSQRRRCTSHGSVPSFVISRDIRMNPGNKFWQHTKEADSIVPPRPWIRIYEKYMWS